MICSFKTMTIMLAGDGAAFLMSADREGMEDQILKEKFSSDSYRKYYCANCKTEFKGEELSDWELVKEHFGTKPVPKWYDIADEDIMDWNDTRVPPALRRPLKVLCD